MAPICRSFFSTHYLLLSILFSLIATIFAAPVPTASTIGPDQCYNPDDLSWNPADITQRLADEDHQQDLEGYPCRASSSTVEQAVVEGSGAALTTFGLKASMDWLKRHNSDPHPNNGDLNSVSPNPLQETTESTANILEPLSSTDFMAKMIDATGDHPPKSLSKISNTKLLTKEMAPELDSQAIKSLTQESIQGIPDSVITNMKLATLTNIEPNIAAEMPKSAQKALYEALRSPQSTLHTALWDFFKGNDFNTPDEVKSLPTWLWEIFENGVIMQPK